MNFESAGKVDYVGKVPVLPEKNLQERDVLVTENNWGKTLLLEEKFLIMIPVLAILLAEILIYSGRIKEAVWLHIGTLLALSLSRAVIESENVHKTHQALMLLPILRLVNLSMPVFFDITLYTFIFIYAPLAIPVAITALSQNLTKKEMGFTLKNIIPYLLLGILISIPIGEGEYFVIRTGYLIPDLSFQSLLEIIVVMVFFVGFIEEIIFRSILQTRLEKVFGTWKSLLLASLLFGVMHSGYGTPYEIIYVSFVGLTIGYIFQKTRSLPLITAIHGFVNVFLFGVIPHLGPGLGLM